MERGKNAVKVQQGSAWLGPTPLAGQCRYIFLFWVLYLRCRSLSHFLRLSPVRKLRRQLGSISRIQTNDGVGSERGLCPPPTTTPPPRGLRNEDRGDPAVIRGLLQPEGATRTPVGQQRQSDRFLSLASSVPVIRIGNQTLPQLLSKCRIFLSRCLFCSLTHSC